MILRAGLLLAAGALLAAGIHAAVVRGLADATYTRARLELAPSARARTALPPAALASAQASMREALALEPSNPLFVEVSARLDEMQALSLVPGDAEARRLLGQSLGEFRAAALMRPGSAYAWVSIALLKVRLGELDAEFYGALERAARLGPWEPQVQIAIADIGLAAWRRLSQPAQTQVIDTLERGLLRPGPEIRRIATKHGILPLVCGGASLPPRVAALCVKK